MSVTKADLIEALKSLIFPDTKMREALREELRKQTIKQIVVKHSLNPIQEGVTDLGRPCIIKVGATYYHYFHDSNDGTIKVATSTDGLTVGSVVTVLSGTPATWDVYVGNPHVLYVRGQGYLLYYTGWDAGLTQRIGLATAPAPTGPFAKNPSNPILSLGAPGAWDKDNVYNPNVLYLYGWSPQYWMTYVGNSLQRIGVASAPAPAGPWTRYADNPVLRSVGPGGYPDWDGISLELHHTTTFLDWFVMVYEGEMNGFGLGLAFSKDLRHWAKADSINPVLTPSGYSGRSVGRGGWDEADVVHPFLFPDTDGSFKLYYVGVDADFKHRIGVAFLNPDVLRPNVEPYKTQLTWRLWRDATVPAVGETSFDVPCYGWTRKTIYLLSNQSGVLRIDVDPDGSGAYRTFESGLAVTANTLYKALTEYSFKYMRLFFDPVADATVNAYVVVE